MFRTCTLLAVLLGSIAVSSCAKEGEAEKAGKEMDKAAEKTDAAAQDAAKAAEDATKKE